MSAFGSSMFEKFMDYFDSPAGGYDARLAPPGPFLGFTGALAAFLLPCIGAMAASSASLVYI